MDHCPITASLPSQLRFVRCGKGECWRDANFSNHQIHFGWSEVPHEALARRNRAELEAVIRNAYFTRPFKRQSDRKAAISNSVRELMDALMPEKFTWVTIAQGNLWWCTAQEGITPNLESEREGHFFARCDRAWAKVSLNGGSLALNQLPPSVSVMNRYQGTICDPGQRVSVWRAIRGEQDPATAEFQLARKRFRDCLQRMIEKLHYSKLEDLVDLIFSRAGYSRISRVGGTKKDWDFEAVNPERGEKIAIQVKSRATQSDLANYERRNADPSDVYDRLYFVVAQPTTRLSPSDTTTVWDSARLAELAELRGLGQWISEQG